MRWPSAWVDPALLGLLESTPFNCLAMEWSGALAPVAAKARAAGLSVVAVGDEAARSAASAAGITPPPEPVLLAAGSVWPGIAGQASFNGQTNVTELSGPTANPWIDSNGWLLRLARVRTPEKTVWLMFTPPAAPRVVLPDDYLRAIADTGAWGGRWVVSLDAALQGGLASGDAKALASWKAIAAAVGFFEQRRAEWSALAPLGVAGVISDFSGPNETTSQEILNLMGRRSLAYRILEKPAVANASLDGFKVLIYVDEGAPSQPLRRKLLGFANQGGLLMVGAAWNQPEGQPTGMDHPRVDVRRLGKGRLAVCRTDSPDPFMIARDVHMLLGRQYDVARFFNLSAFLSLCTASPDRTREVVQIVSFAIRFPNDLATAWVPGKYASARLWSLGSEGSSPVETAAENGGTSLFLPPVPVYAGIELSGKKG
jgi:hypothetical protein